MSEVDTIYALSSGRPPAAISIIRISGPSAHDAGRSLAGELPSPRIAALRDLRDPLSGEFLDQAIVVRYDSPASATGENIVELQCHGGRAVVDAVLGGLASLDGLRAARPGEFTRRAFENGRIDLTEAEGLADLIEAETETQRRAALALVEGTLRKQVARWQEQLLGLSAEAERAIDYDEGDELNPALQRACAALAEELHSWLARPRLERLKEGLRIVVAGPPNAGKSSLVNALAGEDRAIVTDVPGTTRDHIEIPLSLNGLPILLTDTAGLRQSEDKVEAIGISRAENLIQLADVLVWLGAPGDEPAHPSTIRVHAKSDLTSAAAVPPGSLAVSAVTGAGISELAGRLESITSELMPVESSILLNRRQAEHLEEAANALAHASGARDLLLLAEDLRLARSAFDRLTGRAGIEDVLDSLFSRFCLGK